MSAVFCINAQKRLKPATCREEKYGINPAPYKLKNYWFCRTYIFIYIKDAINNTDQLFFDKWREHDKLK